MRLITSLLLLAGLFLAGCNEEQRYSYRYNSSDHGMNTDISREGMITSMGN
jgi:hypothetical protein